MLDEEVARVAWERRAEAVGRVEWRNCLMRERAWTVQGGSHGIAFLIPIVIPPSNILWLSGCETRPKNRIKNIVNGYPEWKKMLSLLRNLEPVVNASATSQTAAMMSLDLNLQFAAMKDLVPAKY
ncbi:hypothetical protein BYT27DRAFT_7259055 [Phlegmacium glaucopus]|nr:hypothetical protein BYT27DRAFT_7259055 [Phlegmacium glaucopus]